MNHIPADQVVEDIVTIVKNSKQAEIEYGLEFIRVKESDIIRLAEQRYNRLLVSGSVEEFDRVISDAICEMHRDTVNNLALQKIWSAK